MSQHMLHAHEFTDTLLNFSLDFCLQLSISLCTHYKLIDNTVQRIGNLSSPLIFTHRYNLISDKWLAILARGTKLTARTVMLHNVWGLMSVHALTVPKQTISCAKCQSVCLPICRVWWHDKQAYWKISNRDKQRNHRICWLTPWLLSNERMNDAIFQPWSQTAGTLRDSRPSESIIYSSSVEVFKWHRYLGCWMLA